MLLGRPLVSTLNVLNCGKSQLLGFLIKEGTVLIQSLLSEGGRGPLEYSGDSRGSRLHVFNLNIIMLTLLKRIQRHTPTKDSLRCLSTFPPRGSGSYNSEDEDE